MSAVARTLSALLAGVLTILAVACASVPANVVAPSSPPTPTEALGPSVMEVLAPIEEVAVSIGESYPPQYFLHVKSGLPNGCVRFDRYEVTRNGNTIAVKVINVQPADREIMCTMVYGIVQHDIPLGSDFESGEEYLVEVNDAKHMFVAQ